MAVVNLFPRRRVREIAMFDKALLSTLSTWTSERTVPDGPCRCRHVLSMLIAKITAQLLQLACECATRNCEHIILPHKRVLCALEKSSPGSLVILHCSNVGGNKMQRKFSINCRLTESKLYTYPWKRILNFADVLRKHYHSTSCSPKCTRISRFCKLFSLDPSFRNIRPNSSKLRRELWECNANVLINNFYKQLTQHKLFCLTSLLKTFSESKVVFFAAGTNFLFFRRWWFRCYFIIFALLSDHIGTNRARCSGRTLNVHWTRLAKR